MRGVRVQRQCQRVGLHDAYLIGQLIMPCLSSSSDRGEVRCRLGGPYRPSVPVGGDTCCRSGVARLQSSPTSPTFAPAAVVRSRTWPNASRARCVALSMRSGARGTFPDRSSWSAFCGPRCVGAGRRHRLLPPTVPREVLEPLASEAALRQLTGCHPL
jgi:hypothetical protein